MAQPRKFTDEQLLAALPGTPANIAKALGVTQPTVSKRLVLLYEASPRKAYIRRWITNPDGSPSPFWGRGRKVHAPKQAIKQIKPRPELITCRGCGFEMHNSMFAKWKRTCRDCRADYFRARRAASTA